MGNNSARSGLTPGPLTSFRASSVLGVPGPPGPPGPPGAPGSGSATYGLDLGGSDGAQQVIGLKSHALPALTTGFLQWTGSAWALPSLPIPVSQGGTGASSLTAHAVLIGEGTSPVAAVALTGGQILVGQVGADPAAQTVIGDASLAATGALTLATTGVTAATYGDATHVAQVTFDAKGRATSASNVSITFPSSLPPSGTAGGDLTGSYPNPSVGGLKSHALPSLSTGGLTWTGSAWAFVAASSTTWADDMAGSTGVAQYVAALSGNAGGGGTIPIGGSTATTLAWLANQTAPTLTQTAPASDLGTYDLTFQAQNAYFGGSHRGGNLDLFSGTGNSGSLYGQVNLGVAGSTQLALVQVGTNAWHWQWQAGATGSNPVFFDCAALTSDIQPTSITIEAGSAWGSASTHQTGATVQIQGGTSQNGSNGGGFVACTGGTNGFEGTVLVGASAIQGPTGSPWAWGYSVIAVSTGTLTLSSAQMATPLLQLNGTLTGNATIVFPNQPGFWVVDTTNIALAGFSLTFKSGSAQFAAAAGKVYMAVTYGANSLVCSSG